VRRDRIALGLIVVGTVFVFGGVPVAWIGLAAAGVGAVGYAEARRRESLATFSILLGALSMIFVLSIFLFFLAVPSGAVGLVLAGFARPGGPRIAGFVLNGLAFLPSSALVIWFVLT
jgi:hypothetical protein